MEKEFRRKGHIICTDRHKVPEETWRRQLL